MRILIRDAWAYGVYPPTSERYSAIDGDTYGGPGSPIGTGPGPDEAEQDLLDQISDRALDEEIKLFGPYGYREDE